MAPSIFYQDASPNREIRRGVWVDRGFKRLARLEKPVKDCLSERSILIVHANDIGDKYKLDNLDSGRDEAGWNLSVYEKFARGYYGHNALIVYFSGESKFGPQVILQQYISADYERERSEWTHFHGQPVDDLVSDAQRFAGRLVRLAGSLQGNDRPDWSLLDRDWIIDALGFASQLAQFRDEDSARSFLQKHSDPMTSFFGPTSIPGDIYGSSKKAALAVSQKLAEFRTGHVQATDVCRACEEFTKAHDEKR